MNEIIKPKKLTITKKNCENVKKIILLSKIFASLKFLIENQNIKKEKQRPKIKEQYPIKLAKIYFPSNASLTSGGI